MYFEKNLFADFNIMFYFTSTRSFLPPFGLQEEVFPKIGSSEFSVASYTILFHPSVKTHLTTIISKVIFPLAKSCQAVDIHISTY